MRAEVRIERVERKKVGGWLPTPREMTEMLAEIEESVAPMLKVGDISPVNVFSAYSKAAMEWYVGNGPKGLALANDVCCHGARVSVTTYRVYYMEQRAAHSPADFHRRYGYYPRVWKAEKGRKEVALLMKGDRDEGLGRAGGATGWDKWRDCFGFALASFKHNFQALLGAFVSRPKLPCSEEWHLPNLVCAPEVVRLESKYHARIVKPPVAVPPASYHYSWTIPTPVMTLAIGTKCPRKTVAYLEFWDRNKKDLCYPVKVEFDEGETETIVAVRAAPGYLFDEGYLNINPTNSEMTVSYVDVLFPPL